VRLHYFFTSCGRFACGIPPICTGGLGPGVRGDQVPNPSRGTCGIVGAEPLGTEVSFDVNNLMLQVAQGPLNGVPVVP
jgi:hypothetical protein